MDLNQQIKNGLQQAAKNQGATLKDIAKKIGIAPNNLYLSLNRGNITLKTLQKYCEALGITPADIFIPENKKENEKTKIICPHCKGNIYISVKIENV